MLNPGGWSIKHSQTNNLFLHSSGVPVCFTETQRLPLQRRPVCERHCCGQDQLLLRVPLRSRFSAGQEELLPLVLAGWWDTMPQVSFQSLRDGRWLSLPGDQRNSSSHIGWLFDVSVGSKDEIWKNNNNNTFLLISAGRCTSLRDRHGSCQKLNGGTKQSSAPPPEQSPGSSTKPGSEHLTFPSFLKLIYQHFVWREAQSLTCLDWF